MSSRLRASISPSGISETVDGARVAILDLDAAAAAQAAAVEAEAAEQSAEPVRGETQARGDEETGTVEQEAGTEG